MKVEDVEKDAEEVSHIRWTADAEQRDVDQDLHCVNHTPQERQRTASIER